MADGMRGARVQLGGRLVHEQHVGFGADGARQHETLRLAAGEVGEPAVGRVFEVK